jgi:hypothetical protein
MMVVNILLVLNVSAYYSTIAEGLILILAVLAGSLSRASPLARHMRRLFVRTRARRDGLLPGQRSREAHLLRLPDLSHSHARRGAATPGWLTRHADTLRFAVPAYVCLVLVLLVTRLLSHELVLFQLPDCAVIVLGRSRWAACCCLWRCRRCSLAPRFPMPPAPSSSAWLSLLQ